MEKRNQYQQEAYDKGSEIAQELTTALNSMTYEKEVIQGFVDQITKSHRTLQQSTMRAVSALIFRWAEMKDKGHYDLRNEATVNSCSIMKRSMEKENICIPFI